MRIETDFIAARRSCQLPARPEIVRILKEIREHRKSDRLDDEQDALRSLDYLQRLSPAGMMRIRT
jgi:hypothetical protein